MEFWTETVLKEIKHVISGNHEYGNWGDASKILLLRKIDFSHFWGKYPKKKSRKTSFINSEFPVQIAMDQTKATVSEKIGWDYRNQSKFEAFFAEFEQRKLWWQ